MKLYHVTFDLSEPDKKMFYPRVPKSAGLGEDKSLKRICLAPTVEECFQALPSDKRHLAVGEKFRLYSIDLDDNDPNLIYPDEIFKKGYVPDALENHEYWYKECLCMDSVIGQIEDFDSNFELSWSCIKLSDVREIVNMFAEDRNDEEKEYLKRLSNKNFSLPEDLYKETIEYFKYINDLDAYDELWENIACLPWAQSTKIYQISWKIVYNI